MDGLENKSSSDSEYDLLWNVYKFKKLKVQGVL